jgi:hypothetical protein
LNLTEEVLNSCVGSNLGRVWLVALSRARPAREESGPFGCLGRIQFVVLTNLKAGMGLALEERPNRLFFQASLGRANFSARGGSIARGDTLGMRARYAFLLVPLLNSSLIPFVLPSDLRDGTLIRDEAYMKKMHIDVIIPFRRSIRSFVNHRGEVTSRDGHGILCGCAQQREGEDQRGVEGEEVGKREEIGRRGRAGVAAAMADLAAAMILPVDAVDQGAGGGGRPTTALGVGTRG